MIRVLQTLQCIALISSNSHPAKIPSKRVGAVPFLQLNQLLATLRRVQALSCPALQTLYASGMFSNERQQQPLKASYAARSTLVVMPSSILHQWEKELSDWAPFLDVFVFQGSDIHIHEVATAKLLTCDVALISCTSRISVLHRCTLLLTASSLQGPPFKMSTGELVTTSIFATPRPATPLRFFKFISGASSWTRRST